VTIVTSTYQHTKNRKEKIMAQLTIKKQKEFEKMRDLLQWQQCFLNIQKNINWIENMHKMVIIGVKYHLPIYSQEFREIGLEKRDIKHLDIELD
jgi:hypothetical protein